MPKPVITFVFKVLYGMDCFGAYSTHAQTCDNVRVQSETQWTASVHILGQVGQVGQVGLLGGQVGQVGLLGVKWAKVGLLGGQVGQVGVLGSSGPTWRGGQLRQDLDCFGTYSAHAQTCDNVRVQSATEWSASVHTLHMPKAVITFVFKVLRNGLLRYILYTCPNL